MKTHLTLGAALLGSALLGACATSAMQPPELVQARASVNSAALDAAVLTHAPLELKRATDSLARADALQADGDSSGEVASLAHVAQQQARTAVAVAQAKSADASIVGAQAERERARADASSVRARNAGNRADAAQAQASSARQQTANAERRADAAQEQTDLAQADRAQALAQSTELQDQLTALQAKQTERGLLVTLGDVLFEFNRADVRPQAQTSLRKLAEFLQQHPSRLVLIEGHTDSVGSERVNEALSLRRADAVDAALVNLGVAAQRVTTAGFGEAYPIAANTTDTSRALNRRVEVYIADDGKPVQTRR